MYSEDDINSAVEAGALAPEAAASFRAHMTKVRELPRGSEENFRLINSFNDIFVAIGIVILLVAVGAIGLAFGEILAPPPDLTWWELQGGFGGLDGGNSPSEAEIKAWQTTDRYHNAMLTGLAGLLVAGTSWLLSEFFTRKRRMALPSILLLLAFVGGSFAAMLGAGMFVAQFENATGALLVSAAGFVGAGAAYVHWRRFMVPITVAAGTAAASVTVIALILAAIGPDNLEEGVGWGVVFAVGLTVFAFAMRWDISDRERITRRSDVAFWLHLLAAPMIAHPIFAMLGVTEGDDLGVGAAIGVLAVYVGFGLVALAIDRRALLVSALAYVLFALTFLFREFGAVELNFALTALVIGSALLSLSAFWQPIRHAVVGALPAYWQAKLPATEDAPIIPEATAA